MNSKELVSLGSFVKHHGLNGELKVFLYNENSETLIPGILIWLKGEKEFISYELESIRGSKNNLLVKLKNINSRESSQFLIKKKLYVSRSNFPDLNEGFYINDIIGFKVKDDHQKFFGYLKDVLIIAGREILLVEYLKKEIMIPNVEEFVKLFDFENKIVIINNLEQFIKE